MSTSESSTKASSTRDSSSRRERQKNRWLVAVALSRSRLARATLSRIGFVSGMSLAASFAVFAIMIRASDGPAAPLDGLFDVGAGSIAAVACAPTMLAAATDRRTADRDGGIEALAGMRGLHATHLDLVRTYAAMMHIARTTALPLLLLAVTLAALASTAGMALRRLAIALGFVVFSAVAGVALGSVSALSARIGGRRGKLTAATIVLLPWIVGEIFNRGIYSIPGALSAFLTLIVDAGVGV